MSQRKLLQHEGLKQESTAETKADFGLTILVMFSLAAAWAAAGSVGLLSHPLRKILILLFSAIVILAPRPSPWQKKSSIFLMLITICIAIFMVMSPLPVINILAVALVLAIFSIISTGQAKRISGILSSSVLIFSIYRFAYTGIPSVWQIVDKISRIPGYIAGSFTGKPLMTGSTFGGFDFLILMSAFWILCLAFSPKPKLTKAVYGFLGIFAGNLCYLFALSYVPELLEMIAVPATPANTVTGEVAWSWAGLLHKALPWNVPVLACVIQIFIAAAIFRWLPWPASQTTNVTCSKRKKYLTLITGGTLAILLPLIFALYPNQLSLQGKKIVFNEKGFLNWLKPEHGQYGRLSSGMYGMLPVFVESMGATGKISENLSDEDISDADVLVLLFPDEPWSDGQLERIWNFVKKGGSLLVLGEHTTRDNKGSNRFNELLEPTNIQVEFDCATFTVGGWLQSYEPLLHPATTGIPDERNQFGVVIGASLNIRWPAKPLLIGKWGWSDMGDQGSASAMIGDNLYNAGEKLGDLILAAEQPLGKGRVIAFGDTSGFTNGINVSSYVFTSRLFGYLAGHNNANSMFRQLSGIIICILLILFVLTKPRIWNITIIIFCLSISLIISNAVTKYAGEILPDG